MTEERILEIEEAQRTVDVAYDYVPELIAEVRRLSGPEGLRMSYRDSRELNKTLSREIERLSADLENERARELKHRTENQSLKNLLREAREWLKETDYQYLATAKEADALVDRIDVVLGDK